MRGNNQTGSQCSLREGGGGRQERRCGISSKNNLFLEKRQTFNLLLLPPSTSPDLHPSSALVVSSINSHKTKQKHRIRIHRVPSFYPSKWTRHKKEKHGQNKSLLWWMNEKSKEALAETKTQTFKLKYHFVCALRSRIQYLAWAEHQTRWGNPGWDV